MSLFLPSGPRPLLLALAAGGLSLNLWAQSAPPQTTTVTPPASVSTTTAGTASPAGERLRSHPHGHVHRHEQGPAHRLGQRMQALQQRQAQALQSLARALQLQPAQQAAWQAFEDAMKARPAHAHAATAPAQAKSDLPAQVAQLRARKAERDALLEQRLQATLALHAQLDANQQQLLGEHAARWLRHSGGHHRQPRMGHGHGQRHGHVMAPGGFDAPQHNQGHPVQPA